MTSSFQPGGFQPPQQTNYGEQFAQAAQNYLNSFQIPFAMQQRNEEAATQNAKQVTTLFDDNTLNSLSTFSKSINDMLKQEGKKRVENQLAEGKAMVLDGRINIDHLKAHRQEVAQLRSQQDKADVVAAKATQEGAPFEAVNPIRKLSGWQQYAAIATLTKQLGDEYGPWADDQFLNNDTDAYTMPDGSKLTPKQARAQGTPAQQKIVRAFLRNKYLVETGLVGVSSAVLVDHAQEAFGEADRLAAKRASAEFAINESSKSLELAEKEFLTLKDPNAFLNSVIGLQTENGPITRSQALDRFQKLLAGGLQSSKNIDGTERKAQLTFDDYQRIKNTPIQGDPNNQTWGQRLGNRFNEIEDAVAAANRRRYDEGEQDRQRRFEQSQRDLVKAIGLNGTDAEYDAAIRKLLDNPEFDGLKPSILEYEKEKNSVQAKVLDKYRTQLTALADAGRLTSDILARYPAKIRAEFSNFAREGDSYSTPEYKTWEKVLENFVRTETKTTVDGALSPSATFMIPVLTQRFRARVKELKAIDNRNPEQTAYGEIILEYKQGRADKSSIFYKDATGFPNVFQTSASTIRSTKAANARLRQLDSMISGGKAALLTKPFYTKEQRQALDLNYGKPGWTPDDQAVYIASKLNVNPMTVINLTRRGLGLPELGLPPSIIGIEDKVRPDFQKFLNRYQGPERATRALNSMGWEPAIVPMNLGDTIERAARQHNIEPSLLAGLLEKESSWRQDIISGKTKSSVGATGIAQFMPDTARSLGVNPLNVESSIYGAAKYLSSLRKQYGSINKALAHYGGYGGNDDDPVFQRDYLNPILTKAAKFGYGNAWRDPGTMRPSMSGRVPFIVGDTGSSTGPHVDVRVFSRKENKYINPAGIADKHLFINGKPISQASTMTSGFGNRIHPIRGGLHFHAGIDFAAPANTRVDVRARYLSTGYDQGGGGYVSRYLLPNGDELVLMHGSQKNAN